MAQPARILIVHNAYQQQGGEDSVVEAETALLRARGHAVELYGRHNNEITELARAQLAVETVWSSRTTRQFSTSVTAFRPDVVHVHNTFPLISPSVYWAAHRLHLPVIQTLHNFRLHCPQAMYLREGKVCEDCLGHLPLAGIKHGCYRGSRTQTGVLVAMLGVHRALGTWQDKVTRFIALNEFCRAKFIAGGLPADRIVVKPNFVDFDAPPPSTRAGFLFVGRLSPEKGVATLAQAAAALECVVVKVVGKGPQESLLNGVRGIEYLGGLSADEVRTRMCAARALIIPSIWYENFPRTLVEALACGLPIIASRIGALADLIEDGVTGLFFTPGNADELAEKMRWVSDHPAQMAVMGRNARIRYEKQYTAASNYDRLMEIYSEAIHAHASTP